MCVHHHHVLSKQNVASARHCSSLPQGETLHNPPWFLAPGPMPPVQDGARIRHERSSRSPPTTQHQDGQACAVWSAQSFYRSVAQSPCGGRQSPTSQKNCVQRAHLESQKTNEPVAVWCRSKRSCDSLEGGQDLFQSVSLSRTRSKRITGAHSRVVVQLASRRLCQQQPHRVMWALCHPYGEHVAVLRTVS